MTPNQAFGPTGRQRQLDLSRASPEVGGHLNRLEGGEAVGDLSSTPLGGLLRSRPQDRVAVRNRTHTGGVGSYTPVLRPLAADTSAAARRLPRR